MRKLFGLLLLLSSVVLAQTPPATRRSTPAADDPGMVVRQVGTVTVTGVLPASYFSDGGVIGYLRMPDGGAQEVACVSGCSGSGGSGNSWVPDGGNIGFMLMPDAGALQVYVINPSGGGSGWVPDGGYIGLVGLADGGGVFVTNTSLAVTGPLTDTQLRAVAVPVSGTVAVSSVAGSVAVTGPLTDTQLRASAVPISGTVTANAGTGTMAVSAAALPLPTGAATSALQTSGNSSLSSIDTKTLAAGQGTMAASSPVVIASNQSSIPVTLASTTITGSVAVTGPLTDTQLRAVAVPVSGTVTTSPPANASTNVAQMGGVATSMNTGVRDTGTQRVTIATNDVVPVTGAFFQATQPVSLTSTTITGPVAVTGPLTDTQLRATPVPVSGTVTATVASTTITGSVAVTGPLTDTQLRAAVVPVSLTSTTITGTVTANEGAVASANNDGACVSVTLTTTVLATNASRRSAVITASSANTAITFVKLGATATSADYPLDPGASIVLDARTYTGVVDALAASGTQSVCVFELN